MSNTITSEEVNYLVLRYLQECGYTHAAFTFGHESQVFRSDIDGSTIPPGALLSFLQRGVSYAEIEAQLAASGDVAGARGGRGKADGTPEAAVNGGGSGGALGNLLDVHRALVRHQRHRARAPAVSPAAQGYLAGGAEEDAMCDTDGAPAAAHGGAAERAKPDTEGAQDADPPAGALRAIKDSEVTTLYGHTSEVFVLAWNPTRHNLLASGSGDATARLWAIPSGPCGQTAVAPPLELRHFGDDSDAPGREDQQQQQQSRDVTAVDWSPDGRRLASASYDGLARIWSETGVLQHRLACHRGPVLSLRWSRSGGRLLSGSVDHTAAVWDGATGECLQQFASHRAAVLDVDWQSEDTFASSSSDKMICVHRLGEPSPLRVFYGHQDEVNAIEWSSDGKLLASCSDDGTVKIWRPNRHGHGGGGGGGGGVTAAAAAIVKQDTDGAFLTANAQAPCDYLVGDLTGHTKEVYTIRWAPPPPPSSSSSLLASASFDGTVRIWDTSVAPTAAMASAAAAAASSPCKMTLARHMLPVYTVAWSPCGDYIASGSSDRCLHVWSVRDGGSLVRTFRGQGGVFEVAWSATGDKIAAALSNGTVNVIDIRA